MKVGFTGTQRGLTDPQYDALWNILYEEDWWEPPCEFHHGDCIGADDVAHSHADVIGAYNLIVHPPSNSSKRAFCRGNETRKPKPYPQRNHDIVDETQVLVACPGEDHEVVRSGTWATIRYARKRGREIHIIFPDGSVRVENPYLAEALIAVY